MKSKDISNQRIPFYFPHQIQLLSETAVKSPRIQHVALEPLNPKFHVPNVHDDLQKFTSVIEKSSNSHYFLGKSLKQKKAYYHQLHSALHYELSHPGLKSLEGSPKLNLEVVEQANINASLRFSKQLAVLQFTFQKFYIRWRLIKQQSAFELWERQTKEIIFEEKRFRQLELYARKIQRYYRRWHHLDLEKERQRGWDAHLALIIQEAERKRLENIKCVHMAVQLQKIWRGHAIRSRLCNQLVQELENDLRELAIHHLFGNLKQVQIHSGYIYSIRKDEEDEIIIHAHRVLKRIECHPGWILNELIEVINKIRFINVERKESMKHRRSERREKKWVEDERMNKKKILLEKRRDGIRRRREEREHLQKKNQIEKAKEYDNIRNNIKKLLFEKEMKHLSQREELEAMQIEEINQRKREKEIKKMIEDEKEKKIIQKQIESSKITYIIMKKNRAIQDKERHEMGRCELEQRYGEHIEKVLRNAFTHNKNFYQQEINNYIVQTHLHFLPNLSCPESNASAVELFIKVMHPKKSTCYYCQVNNIVEIIQGTFAIAQLKQNPFKQISKTWDKKFSIIEDIWNEHIIKVERKKEIVNVYLQPKEKNIKQEISLRIPLNTFTMILKPSQYYLLLPSNHLQLITWIKTKIILNKRNKLILQSEPLDSFMHSSNSPLVQLVIDKAKQQLQQILKFT